MNLSIADGSKRVPDESLWGQGNSVPLRYSQLCDTKVSWTGSGNLVPSENMWWVCSTGLTPCIHPRVLNASSDFCVLVQLILRIAYRSGKDVFNHLTPRPHKWSKMEPITALVLSTLLDIGIARAIGTRTSALVLQDAHYQARRLAIDRMLRD